MVHLFQIMLSKRKLGHLKQLHLCNCVFSASSCLDILPSLKISGKVRFLKERTWKNVVIPKLAKTAHQFPAVREGSFCKFWDEYIFPSTFKRKTVFSCQNAPIFDQDGKCG